MKTCFVYSYRYPPSYSVGAKRNHAIVSALSKKYDFVIVFTSKLIGWQSTCRYLNPANVKVVFIPSIENFFRSVYSLLIKPFSGKPKPTLLDCLDSNKYSQPQYSLCVSSLSCFQGYSQPLITARDLVKSSTGFFWSFIAVAITPYFFVRFGSLPSLTVGLTMPAFCVCPCLLLKWLLAIPFVLDIRDYWPGNPGERPPSILTQLLLSQLERISVRYSTLTTVVTSGLKELISNNPKVIILPNTFVCSDLKAYAQYALSNSYTCEHSISDSKLYFSYLGTVDYTRSKSLIYFMDVINFIKSFSPIDLSINIYTSFLGSDVSLPSVDYLNIFRAVPLDEVIGIQRTSSVLLALTGDVSIAYPVKLNEYMLSGKPIIIIGSRFSPEVLRIPALSYSPVLILDASMPINYSAKSLLDFFPSIASYKVVIEDLLASYSASTIEDIFLSFIHDFHL